MSDPTVSAAPMAGLRQCTRYITSHDDSAKSIFLPTPELIYHERYGNRLARTYSWSRVPSPLEQDADLKLYRAPDDSTEATACSYQANKVAISGGVNSVYLDIGPGSQSPMHRTVSIDLVVVIEGKIELELDSGQKKTLYQGDSVVQRGTMHRWRNPSSTKPARFLAVLVSAEKSFIGGKELQQEYLPN
ncbi:hypothetical protein BO83DRAFT_413836 [Aspergillus eucalypticola CBS 122712]|uniref:Cupin type-2 domain-containing protein n=1 Tax=Aspergillus eucalypticola (strain CBS 122712 / IBT 29274) TaxID=1448314 RepID=A0A317WJJ7_ASPEC|nr:uncharacterized protein BO83DRAFT_413836 [Aspergillus eucalypticola CBS 122712]PWY84390.1 hypothetical protein BO83DRAFT_413836 [Aspergillus eucalypticola CBS 122712]